MLYNNRFRRKTAEQIESEEIKNQREDREFVEAMQFLAQQMDREARGEVEEQDDEE